MSGRVHSTLVVLRHGESYSNLNHTYSGWYDTDLTEKGKKESVEAAELLKKHNFHFDVCYSSLLKRAIRTMWITLDVLDQMWIPTHSNWRLNECHFGCFTGKNKEQIYSRFSQEDIKAWKTDTSFRPPPTDEGQENPADDPKYKSLDPHIIPNGESIDMMWKRALPYFVDHIIPDLIAGKTVLVVVHGNVHRAIKKYFEHLTGVELMKQPVVPNGFPYVIEFDENMNVINTKLIGEEEAIQRSIYLSDGIL